MKLFKVLLSLTLCLSVITMNASYIKAEQLPDAYNIKDNESGLLDTQLKNHYANMSWSYSLTNAMDINIRKKNLADMDNNGLSPYHLTYFSQRFISDPLGGTLNDNYWRCLYGMQNLPTKLEQVMAALMTWGAGPVYYNEMIGIYDRSNIIEECYDKRIATPHTAILFEKDDISDIQEFIYKNGAVVAEFNYSQEGMDSYNSEYEAQYQNTFIKADQVITIIGWDDHFSKEKFNASMQPLQDGAWYCRDTRSGAAKYKWISYYDESLAEIWGIELTHIDTYDNNYQYDAPTENDVKLSYNNSNMTQANVFTIKANTGKKEQIKAVHFDTDQRNIKYTIQLYKNPILDDPTGGEPLLSEEMTGVLKHNGKYTIDLDEIVVLNDGDHFSVVIRFESLDNQPVSIPTEINSSSKEGESYYTNDSIYGWNKLINDGNVRIKAFTTNIDKEIEVINVNDIVVSESEIVLSEGEEKQLDVTVLPDNATNKKLSYQSSHDYIVSVNNGVLTALKPGTATITVQSLASPFVYKTIDVTVTKKEVLPNAIDLQTSSIQLTEDDEYKINAAVLPENADNKTLKYISDSDCISVDNNGNVKALKEGHAIISVETVNGIKEFINVTVIKKDIPITSITLETHKVDLKVGEEYELNYTILPADTTDSKDINIIIEDETIVSYENNKLIAKKPGSTSITFKTVNGISDTCEITVSKEFLFTDVSDKQWYYDYINESYQLGLMTGATDTLFKPTANMNRGMAAIVFHRMEGAKPVAYSKVFPDVADNQYYTTSVLWAKQTGFITGYNNGTFMPLKEVTREEMATMIQRFAKYKGLDVTSSKDITYFKDYANISTYAKQPIQWCVENGVLSGKFEGTKVDPQGQATRAEACKMLLNAYKLINK